MGWRMAGGNCCCDCVIERDAYVETVAATPPKGRVTKRYPNSSPPFPTGVAGDFVYFDHKNQETYVTAATNLGIYKLDHAMKVRTDILTYPGGGAGTWRIRQGICVDYSNEQVYFAAHQIGSETTVHIRRVGFDGSGDTSVASFSGYAITSHYMQMSGGGSRYVFLQMAWQDALIKTVPQRLRVYRLNTASGSLSTIVDTVAPDGEMTSSVSARGIAADNQRKNIYYCYSQFRSGEAEKIYSQIWRCDFDGDNNTELYRDSFLPVAQRVTRMAGYSHLMDRVFFWDFNNLVSPNILRWRSMVHDGGDVKLEIDTNRHAGAGWNGRNSPASMRLACGYEAYPVST
jgi:hypothetical protein